MPATVGEALDKYFTKENVVRKCLAMVEELPHSYDLVIEPSAGNGAFYDKINHHNKIGIDIDPQHKDICQERLADV